MNTTQDYFTLYSNRTEAWEHCQDLAWMFVMLDESKYRYNNLLVAEKTLRQYTCQLARNYWSLICHPDLRKAVEVTEKFILGKVQPEQVVEAGELAKKARISLRVEDTQVGDAARIAEYCAYPYDGEIAAALAAKYALKLGADEMAQVEALRELIGNPYLLAVASIPKQYWWQQKPKPKNLIQFLFHKLNASTDPEVNKRIKFYNFLNEHSSLSEAWNYCQNPEWMLAMLDLYSNYADTPIGQIKLRQYTCWCAREEKIFFDWEDLDERIRIAIEVAERFTTGQATRKDLKEAEIMAFQANDEIEGFRFYIVKNIGLFCTHQSAWLSALETSKYNYGSLNPLQSMKLRELIGNPFDI